MTNDRALAGSDQVIPERGDGGIEHAVGADRPTPGSHARALLAQRTALAKYFDPALFGDPALDILLFLFAEGEQGASATTTGACCAAARVPRTTALRWIKLLEERGLVTAATDADDARRTFLRLSDDAKTKLRNWLAETALIAPAR